jgi:hypothetical protein
MKNLATTDFIDDLINIVVYDKNTEHTNQLIEVEDDMNLNDIDACGSETFPIILLNKLAQKFKSVSFLSGGFVSFNENFAEHCQSTCVSQSACSSLTSTPNTGDSTKFLALNNHQSDMVFNRSTSVALPVNPNGSKPKPHVFKHSISSYDATNEFFRNKLHSPMTLTLNQVAHIKTLSPNNEKLVLSPCKNEINSENNNFNKIDSFSNSFASSTTASTIETPQGLAVIRKPTKILNYLYLGSQEDALSHATMTALNITSVLNVSINCPKPEFICDANFLRIPVNDGHDAKIRPFFDVAYRFIGNSVHF